MDQVTIPRELLQQILSFVEEGNPGHIADKINVLVKLRTALEQPAVQEPVTKITLKDGKYLQLSEMTGWSRKVWCLHQQSGAFTRILDTFETGFVEAALRSAQPRKAVKLTPEEMKAAVEHAWGSARIDAAIEMYGHEYRAIEQAVWEKLGYRNDH